MSWVEVMKINGDLENSLDEWFAINDIITFGQRSVIFSNKNDVLKLGQAKKAVNHKAINGILLENLIVNNGHVGLFFKNIYNIGTSDWDSLTAMNAILQSETAMNAIARSETAMNAIARSETAIVSILQSDTAKDACINNNTTLQKSATLFFDTVSTSTLFTCTLNYGASDPPPSENINKNGINFISCSGYNGGVGYGIAYHGHNGVEAGRRNGDVNPSIKFVCLGGSKATESGDGYFYIWKYVIK